MKFYIEVEQTRRGDCVVEAPSQVALNLWIAEEKARRFDGWYLESEFGDGDFDVNTREARESDGSVDITIGADGKE